MASVQANGKKQLPADAKLPVPSPVSVECRELRTIDSIRERYSMFDIGGGELLLILIVVLVAFGPKKLPELAQSLGRGIREFKRAQRDFTEQINSAIELEHRKQTRTVSRDDTPKEIRRAPQQPVLENGTANPEPALNTPPADQIPMSFAQEPVISPPVGERTARGATPPPDAFPAAPAAEPREQAPPL